MTTINPNTQPNIPLPSLTETAQEEIIQPTTDNTPTEAPLPSSPQEAVNVESNQGQAETTLNLVQEEPTDVVAYGKELFKETFGLSSKSYLRPHDAKLKAELSAYANIIDSTAGMKETLMAKNPRAEDFLYALEKAQQGKNLTYDDVESIQLFLIQDTPYGHELAYKPNDNGMDGKFGFRTHAALHRFVTNFNPTTSLVPNSPDYQRSLDNR